MFNSQREAAGFRRSVVRGDRYPPNCEQRNGPSQAEKSCQWIRGSRPSWTTCTERTVYDQQGYKRNYIESRIGDLKASEVTTRDVRAWIAELGRSGGRSGQGLSANTVRLARSLLRSAFEYAEAEGLASMNPVAGASPPRAVRKLPEHWTPEQARRFLAFQEGDRLYPLWAFMLSTGVRASEFVWLTWDDVDIRSRSVSIRQIPTAIGYRLVEGGKNQTAVRRIDLDDGLLRVLEMQRQTQMAERQATGYHLTNFVFTKE